MSSCILAKALYLNRASPAERASSTSRMSGSMFTATANARRPYMPDEYVRIGISMKSSRPAKSAISSYRSRTSSRVRPAARPPSITFSRPVRLALNPTPSASSVLTRPLTSISPLVGGRMPASARMSVDLPAPFAPTMPMTVPCVTSKLIPRSALTSRMPWFCSPPPRAIRMSRWRMVFALRSTAVRYVMCTSRTDTVVRCPLRSGSTASRLSTDCWSDTDCIVALPGDVHDEAHHEEHQAVDHGAQPGARGGDLAADDRVAPQLEDGAEGVVRRDLGLDAARGVREPQDRRHVEAEPQQVGQEVLEVRVVDLQRRAEEPQAGREEHEQPEDRHGEQQGPADVLAVVE